MTTAQKQLIYGSLLGDASIQINHGVCNPRIKFSHGVAQRELVMRKYDILKEYVSTPPREVPNGGWGSNMIRFTTATQPWLHQVLKICITNGRRSVNEEWLSLLTEEGLAWWVMDDGCIQSAGMRISTEKFTKEENEIIKKWLWDRWAITAIVFNSKNHYWSLRFNKEGGFKLAKLIEPFILPSMRYKLYLPRQIACQNCGVLFLPKEKETTHCNDSVCRKLFKKIKHQEYYIQNRDSILEKVKSRRLRLLKNQ